MVVAGDAWASTEVVNKTQQMAQAARLNLRLQKELKLLMTDPPPGVSLPSLSDNTNLPSLSLLSIEARIEGPEETVYSKGIFSVKIQIPERYPFQPPHVTFVTPIYHPNIDNGGRICLDILNLPPKGAWQPSMNISTILTSIRLLLSEPNPDDALMAETSREYKYNRHVFEQKARNWTERYANPGSTGKSDDRAVLTSLNVVPLEADRAGIPENPVKEGDRRKKKLRLTCQDLPTKPAMPTGMDNNDEKETVIPTQQQSILNKKMGASQSELCNTAKFDKRSLNEHVGESLTDSSRKVETSREFLETIIVSDSESSDDEDDRPSRPRLSLLRKQIAGD